MDGNRRWARERNLPTFEGHARGFQKAKEVAGWCKIAGVTYAILYAFSNENWNRSKEEVAYLTELFDKFIHEYAEQLHAEGGAVRFIGEVGRFGEKFESEARALEAQNPDKPSCTVIIALSYGGRQEIVRAANKLLKEKSGEEITEADFAAQLYTHEIPDPDLIVRTSGEYRLSGFLPWQSTYSELFFVPTYWPDFSEQEFKNVLNEYASRERRGGK